MYDSLQSLRKYLDERIQRESLFVLFRVCRFCKTGSVISTYRFTVRCYMPDQVKEFVSHAKRKCFSLCAIDKTCYGFFLKSANRIFSFKAERFSCGVVSFTNKTIPACCSGYIKQSAVKPNPSRPVCIM